MSKIAYEGLEYFSTASLCIDYFHVQLIALFSKRTLRRFTAKQHYEAIVIRDFSPGQVATELAYAVGAWNGCG